MKTNLTLLIPAAFIATLAMLPAQDGGRRPGPDGAGPRRVPPVIAALDADKNGELSAEEISGAATALLTLDKNGDGKVTGEEMRPEGAPPRGEGESRPPRPEGGKGEGRPQRPESGERPQRPEGGAQRGAPPLVATLDPDHNNELSAEEIAGAPAALKALDKNNDGVLTRDEIMPGGPRRGGGGPRGEGGRPSRPAAE